MSILNTPITINRLSLKNRLVMPPMATRKSAANGSVTPEMCQYYAEKSSGGYLGLVIMEHSYVSPEGKVRLEQLSIAKDEDIAGLRKLADCIHDSSNGSQTKVMAQINHAGSAAERNITGQEVLSASAVPRPNAGSETADIPREMSRLDIQKVIDDFANAAARAKAAGYDGVEIHSAHGYLLNQFFSPLTNKRTDEYNGNTLEGRIRIHLEIIQAIRSAVGENYPIALRLGACDYMPGGSTIEDSVMAAKEFERAGIDLLDISGGFCGYTNPNSNAQGYFSEITEEIKKSIKIPVILTGGILDAHTAERLLAENKADLIGVGRAILKDSDWARRAVLGEND